MPAVYRFGKQCSRFHPHVQCVRLYLKGLRYIISKQVLHRGACQWPPECLSPLVQLLAHLIIVYTVLSTDPVGRQQSSRHTVMLGINFYMLPE